MIDITVWRDGFLKALNNNFENRVWFVGLQGSYGRGEATDTSDIDIVVILDELFAFDIQKYNAMLDSLPHRELICGFLSGKNELLNWEPSDLFQFYYDTTAIKGSLDELLAVIDEVSVNRAIKIGACNIYHGCVHNMLHEKREDILRGLYKSASFVVQAIAFKQTGKYVKHQKDLLGVVSADEREIVEIFLKLKNDDAVEFDVMSEILFTWAKKQIREKNMILETERLILRSFTEADAADAYEYLHEPTVHCFACMKVDSLKEARQAVLERAKDGEYYFAITLKGSGKVIGEIDAMPETAESDEKNTVLDTFSPCWMLNTAYHGKGYAYEAARAFFDYLFKEKGARRIYAYTEDYNVASQRLCEKLGMRHEGLFREFVTFVNDENGDPIYENTYQYAILKKEWKNG